MNQTRSFLLIAWLVVATLLWMEWSKGQVAPVADVAPTSAVIPPPAAPLPGVQTNAPLPSANAPLPGASAPVLVATAATAPITIANDTLRLTVDLQGARVTDSQLLQYTVEKKPGSPNVHLFSATASAYYTADAGLIRVDKNNVQHELEPRFQTASGASVFVLPAGAPSISVPLLWSDPATGLSIERTLTLRRNSYVLELSDKISSAGVSAEQLYPFVRLSRVAPPAPPKHSFMTNPETFSFVGGAWHTPDENYIKAPLNEFGSKQAASSNVSGVWIAMLQHHFVSAWVPAGKDKQALQTSVSSQGGLPLYAIRSVGTPLQLAPGASGLRNDKLWVGPKLQAPLEALAPSLVLTADYGKLAFIAQPLFSLLSWLHSLLGNWGWAIIAIVVLLKLALYPLSAKQYQSMAKMRAVQPRIEALKERYGDDKQKFQLEMMDLYKKEKINPLGGCLPMLIPIPIFLGLYWVLLETVELRHAPWMGWIQNLTAADPYFVLPLLNLVVMFLTQKLTPMPGVDPMQKKIMQFMPLVFGVMMAFFPAGLVLYWVTNGLLGLLQQWWMTKRHGGGGNAGPKPAAIAR